MMGIPAEHLPPQLSAASIVELIASLGLPTPEKVEPLQVTAEFHSIYLIHFTSALTSNTPLSAEPDGSLILVLRVSGRHLPRIKTLNEVGVMTWIQDNTTIPIPTIIRYDETENNPIGHEFTLLEKAPGTSVDKIYDALSEGAKRQLVEQLTEILIQLHSKPWENGYVGGLVLQDEVVVNGPVIEETLWQIPDIQKYWSSEETLSTLNPIEGPFPNYTAYSSAFLEKYIYAISKHPTLEPFRDMIPRLQAFIQVIDSPERMAKLNDVVYVLAHKDLHFANIMCSTQGNITGILDWEFSSVVPAPRWNPPRAFLWNGQHTPESREEHTKMERIFVEVCKEKDAEFLLDDVKMNEEQEQMQTVLNYVRAIVEVCPRGEAQDMVNGWREAAGASLAYFGV
jgi:hypothetical protein